MAVEVNVRYGQSAGAVGIPSNCTTAVTLYTMGDSLVMPNGASGPGGIVDGARIYNKDTTKHFVQLHAIPPADALGDDTLFDRIEVAAGEVVRYVGGERFPSGTVIQVKLEAAHAANPVYVKVDVSEL